MNRTLRYFLILFNLFVVSYALAQKDTVNYHFKKGFAFEVNAGLMAHSSDVENAKFGLTTNHVAIYKFSRFLQIGLGVGFDDYDFFQAMPVSIYYRGELLEADSGPFYYLSGGYAHLWDRNNSGNDEIEGGKTFNVGAGYSWKLDKISICLTMSYKRQQATTTSTPYNYYLFDNSMPSSFYYVETTKWTLNRTEFKIGIGF